MGLEGDAGGRTAGGRGISGQVGGDAGGDGERERAGAGDAGDGDGVERRVIRRDGDAGVCHAIFIHRDIGRAVEAGHVFAELHGEHHVGSAGGTGGLWRDGRHAGGRSDCRPRRSCPRR